MAVPPSKHRFQTALAVGVSTGSTRAKACTRVRFCTAPYPAPPAAAATSSPTSLPRSRPAATPATPAAVTTTATGSSTRVPSRSASMPARHRATAPVAPNSSSAPGATRPSGRSIGRKVTTPLPARVTTSSTSDGTSTACTARRCRGAGGPGWASGFVPAGAGVDPASSRAIRSAAGTASTGRLASSATGQKPTFCATATDPGTTATPVRPIARPYSPAVSPWRPGGARVNVSVDPTTVSTAKPVPRTALTASRGSRSELSSSRGEGAPSASRPAARLRPLPTRRTRAGTAAWVRTVAVSMAVVTRPACDTVAPPRTAHQGRAANVAANPTKPSSVTPTSLWTAGTRHSGPSTAAATSPAAPTAAP